MNAASQELNVVDVILRDGATMRLRPPQTDDAAGLLSFFAGLSADSMRSRFHGVRRVDDSLIEHFLLPAADRGALIGSVETAADGLRVVAIGEYACLRDPSVAEVAFTVADDLQGHGVGARLLEQLAALAGREGVETFVADVLADNHAMLRVFADAGYDVVRKTEGGEVEVRLAIARSTALLARVDARDHEAVGASLRPFFQPATVAVIGASPRRGSIGGELFRNILQADFQGAAYPVNRTAEPVAGVRAFSSVAEIDAPIDLAVICLPAARVVDAARIALATGVRALCVISSGFAEVGRDGLERQEELLALVRSHGARLIGPNCLGIAVPGIGLNATFAPRALPPGRIAFSSQSGALGLALLEKAAERNLGFSAFVSIGNKADVSSNDLLEWWEDDDETELILLYLESFGNPRKFGRLAARVARHKPILALKAGTTEVGARAASSHTAALAGSEVAVDALFRQSGVLRARTLEELVDAATLLSSQPLPRGRRTAVLSNAGGLGILCADACGAAGLALEPLEDRTRRALEAELPADASVANPVDVLGSATAATYATVLPLLLADPGVDSVIVLFVPPVVATADDVAAAIAEAAVGAEKPVLVVIVSADGIPARLRESGSPVASFLYPESAARALGLAADRADWLGRAAGSATPVEGVDRVEGRRLVESVTDERWLSPAEARTLLAAYGIPLVPERVVLSAEEAVLAAEELGFPAVVKSAVPGRHKTESGGVALGLMTAEAVRTAALRIGAPLIVQPMIKGGVELLAGVVQDPVFGPLVAFGPGGVFAELIGDTRFAVAPLTDVDAAELVHGGKAGKLVAGFRGAAPADAAALTDLVHRLALLAEENPEIAELDLNPVLGLGESCLAVDMRIRLRPARPVASIKGW
ncbi:MAG: GNAT family N-acetyltransferase [Actinobacteria bacterium]|nr:GNAT family N-acetyltransferase [Actinomycetota bacterium]